MMAIEIFHIEWDKNEFLKLQIEGRGGSKFN